MSVQVTSQHVCDMDGVPVLVILPPVPMVVVLAYGRSFSQSIAWSVMAPLESPIFDLAMLTCKLRQGSTQ